MRIPEEMKGGGRGRVCHCQRGPPALGFYKDSARFFIEVQTMGSFSLFLGGGPLCDGVNNNKQSGFEPLTREASLADSPPGQMLPGGLCRHAAPLPPSHPGTGRNRHGLSFVQAMPSLLAKCDRERHNFCGV